MSNPNYQTNKESESIDTSTMVYNTYAIAPLLPVELILCAWCWVSGVAEGRLFAWGHTLY